MYADKFLFAFPFNVIHPNSIPSLIWIMLTVVSVLTLCINMNHVIVQTILAYAIIAIRSRIELLVIKWPEQIAMGFLKKLFSIKR